MLMKVSGNYSWLEKAGFTEGLTSAQLSVNPSLDDKPQNKHEQFLSDNKTDRVNISALSIILLKG